MYSLHQRMIWYPRVSLGEGTPGGRLPVCGIPHHPLYGSQPLVKLVIHVRYRRALRGALRAVLRLLLEGHPEPGPVLICRAPLCNPLPDLAGQLGIPAVELVHQNSGDLQLHPIGFHPSSRLRRLRPCLPEALGPSSSHRESLRKRSPRLRLGAQFNFIVMLVASYRILLRGRSTTPHSGSPPPVCPLRTRHEASGLTDVERRLEAVSSRAQSGRAPHQSVRQAAPQPGAQGESTSETPSPDQFMSCLVKASVLF